MGRLEQLPLQPPAIRAAGLRRLLERNQPNDAQVARQVVPVLLRHAQDDGLLGLGFGDGLDAQEWSLKRFIDALRSAAHL